MKREIDLDEDMWKVVDSAGKRSNMTDNEVLLDLVMGLKMFIDRLPEGSPYVLSAPNRYDITVYPVTKFHIENKAVPPISIQWDPQFNYMKEKFKEIESMVKNNLLLSPLQMTGECQVKIAEMVRNVLEEIISRGISGVISGTVH